MKKLLNISPLSLVIALALALPLITSSNDTKAEMTCADCSTNFHSCEIGCPKSGTGSFGCKLGCQTFTWICMHKYCPLQYAVRNGSVYSMNFFSSNGTLIGNRDGWSPHRLEVNETDFPITAAYASTCPTLKDPKCPNNDHYRYIINDPGCHILWYAGGFYTTSVMCYLKGEVPPSKNAPFSPSPPTTLSPQDQKSPATSTGSPSSKEAPSQERHPK